MCVCSLVFSGQTFSSARLGVGAPGAGGGAASGGGGGGGGDGYGSYGEDSRPLSQSHQRPLASGARQSTPTLKRSLVRPVVASVVFNAK